MQQVWILGNCAKLLDCIEVMLGGGVAIMNAEPRLSDTKQWNMKMRNWIEATILNRISGLEVILQ